MVAKNVLRRKASQNDARRIVVVMTALGQRLVAELHALKQSIVESVVADWSPEDIEIFSKLFEKYPNRPGGLDELAQRQLVLQIGVIDRGGDETGHAEPCFQHYHCEQQFPGAGLDPGADDPGIQKVFELVNDHEEGERADGSDERHAQTHNDDDGIGDQVADDRQETSDKGDHDHGLDQRQVHTKD
eukprot:gene24215-29055_t